MNFSKKFGTHKNTVFISLIGGLLLIAVLLTILPANAREVQQESSSAPDGLTAVEWSGIKQQTLASMTASQQVKLTADDAVEFDSFGASVAVSGNTVIVGADWDDDDGNGSGSAYVFIRNGTMWSQQAKLTADDAAELDRFGYSVAVDGDTVVIGAYEDDDAGSSSGSAYVFTRSGTAWNQQAKLTASDAAEYDSFGYSVDVDGDTAVIGARYNNDSGSAYVFTRSGTTWNQQAKLTASDAAESDTFGYSVAVDGDTAIIGARYNNDSGSAYIFTYDGTIWSEQAKLTASDAAANDAFGKSVDVDEDTAIIGASGDNNSGSAYVFTRNGTIWNQQAKLISSDTATNGWFGTSVAMDGNTAVIGAPYGYNYNGSAYVFARSGTTWSEQVWLTSSDGASGDYFGGSVSMDGETVIIGAPEDDDTGSASGSAYVFLLPAPHTSHIFLPAIIR